jgi:integrase
MYSTKKCLQALKPTCEEKGASQAISKIISFGLWMRAQGYKESTVCSSVATLKGLAKRVDLFNCESVKQYLAIAHLTEGRKEKITDDLVRFYKHENIPFDKPHYKRIDILPFIPHEKEIDELIAKMGPKTAAFLQVIKETAGRPGEVWQLKWNDIDVVNKSLTLIPLKGSNPRQFRISDRLIAMLTSLARNSDWVFHSENVDLISTIDNFRTSFEKQRRKAALRLQNSRINQITFKTLRHWKATTEYHKTKDILYVMQMLGHKNIKNTLIYTHLVKFDSADDWICKVASSSTEIQALIESGYEHVLTRDDLEFFRKRK